MAEGSAGLVGKVEPTLNASLGFDLSDAFKDFLNETSSATSSNNTSVPITIGDKTAASGHASTGGVGLVKSVVYVGLAALLIGAFLYWDNGKK